MTIWLPLAEEVVPHVHFSLYRAYKTSFRCDLMCYRAELLNCIAWRMESTWNVQSASIYVHKHAHTYLPRHSSPTAPSCLSSRWNFVIFFQVRCFHCRLIFCHLGYLSPPRCHMFSLRWYQGYFRDSCRNKTSSSYWIFDRESTLFLCDQLQKREVVRKRIKIQNSASDEKGWDLFCRTVTKILRLTVCVVWQTLMLAAVDCSAHTMDTSGDVFYFSLPWPLFALHCSCCNPLPLQTRDSQSRNPVHVGNHDICAQ